MARRRPPPLRPRYAGTSYKQMQRSGRGKRAKRAERKEIGAYMSGITRGKDLGNMTAAMGRWWRARFRMFD